MGNLEHKSSLRPARESRGQAVRYYLRIDYTILEANVQEGVGLENDAAHKNNVHELHSPNK